MPIFYSKSEDKKYTIYTFKTKTLFLVFIPISLLPIFIGIFADASNNLFLRAATLLITMIFIIMFIFDYLPVTIHSWKAVASKKKRIIEQSGGFFSDYVVKIEK